MIKVMRGDIFRLEVDAIVNTVNTVGVMGAGIALQFKLKYPDNFKAYKEYCAGGNLQPGGLFITRDQGIYPYIINLATKDHFSKPSKISWIKDALEELALVIELYEIKSIAIPALGCNNGRLKFNDVLPIIERNLQHLTDVQIYIFEPLY